MENFPEMVQVMNLQIEDSEHILSRVTKNNLNQDIFSQIREGWTPALGSRGPCTPMQLPWSQPDPLASEPGSTQGQGLAGGHSGATLGPSSPKSCPRTLPSLVGVQWLALTTPCTREGGPCINVQSPAWLAPLCPQPQEAWVQVLPLMLCGPGQAHCPL